jgi:hypothetical protein
MASIKTFKIFISHKFKASEDYLRLVETLDEHFSYGHAVISVPADLRYRKMTKAGLEDVLRKQIKNANIFIALDEVYQEENGWARYELEYAVSLGKPILGLRRWKSKEVSEIVENVATLVTGWNPELLVGAIVKYSVPVQINLK